MSERDGVYVVGCDRLHRALPRLARAADVLVLNSVCDADLFPLIAERGARNAATVFEVSDDFSAVQPWNPIYGFYQNPANVRLYKQLARACDAMQHTVPELARLYGHLGRSSRVFVNHLLEMPPPPRRSDGERLRIGWGGSSGHREDIARIAPALCQWISHTPGATLALMCSDSIWELFASLPNTRKARTATGSIDDYYRFVASLDIGLAPLGDTAFNRSRSDVKFVEYAAFGAAAIVQDFEPYRSTAKDGENARVVRDSDGLVAALDALAKSPGERARLRDAAYSYVSTERTQRAHAAERLDFYASLAAGDCPGAVDIAALFGEIESWEGAEVTGRHALLAHTRIERGMHDALVLAQQDGKRAEARSLLADVARRAPALDLPHLYAGGLFADATELTKALKLNPKSVTALVGLGRIALAAGAAAEALGYFVRAIELAPAHDELYRQASVAAAALGAKPDAASLLEHAETLARQLEPAA